MTRWGDVKTVVVDLDRTLLHTDQTISAYTVSVLQACRQRGMKLMVATARPMREIAHFCGDLSFDAVTASNGAKVLCGTRETSFGIGRSSAVKMLRRLQNDPTLRITVETGKCAYSNHPIAEYETVLSDDLVGVAETEGVMKLLVHLDSGDTLEAVQKELTEDVYFTVASGYLLQIMNKAATKWNGIRAMLEIGGDSPAQTVYFGDDHDDVEPLRRCGIGVAVANAIEEAKAAADHIAESNDDDGVAKFLAQLLDRPAAEENQGKG